MTAYLRPAVPVVDTLLVRAFFTQSPKSITTNKTQFLAAERLTIASGQHGGRSIKSE